MKYLLLVSVLLAFNTNAQSLLKTSKGNKFNPAIGINALSLFKNSTREAENDGFSIQEVELQFSSDVDAYFRAEATIGIHQEEAEEGEEHKHGFAVEPEEVFVETTSLKKVTLKFGKFLSSFGKYNAVHSHARPFIYRGVVQDAMFGHEGLAESGIAASFLLPVGWFSEVTAEAIQPTNEELFVETHHALSYALKLKNLWELSDSLTLELGLSGLTASNHSHDGGVEDKTNLLGADLTFKWKPTSKSAYNSFVWSSEFIHKDRHGTNTTKNGGLTSFVKYQVSKRVFAQAQYEFLGYGKNAGVKDVNSYSALLAFIPTEFSAVRAQYDSIHDGKNVDHKRISLQLNISIGAHPAHQY